MFLSSRAPPVVFAGASLPEIPGTLAGRIELLPPARRGDLGRLCARGEPGVALLIDGVFSHALAVTPTECRELIEAGWTLVGAASMGALRASELWSVGMIGVGEIYTLYRTGVLTSDGEVAVALHPDDHRELTASIVHLRAVLQRLAEEDAMSLAEARHCLDAARGIHFLERSWAACARAWAALGVAEQALRRAQEYAGDRRLHPKIRDAEQALRSLLADIWVPAQPG